MPEATGSAPAAPSQGSAAPAGATNAPQGGSGQPPARGGAPAPAQRAPVSPTNTVKPGSQDPLRDQMVAQAKGQPAPVKRHDVRDPPTGQFAPAQAAGGGDAVGDPPQPGETQAQADQRRTFRVKVNGQEMELDEEAARTELEIGLGAKARFTELDQQRREFYGHIEQARQDPVGLLQYLGFDPEQFAVQYLNGVVQQGQMTPEQRAHFQREQQLQQREMALQQEEQRRQQAQWEAEQAQVLDMLREQAPAQLANVGLPADTGLALLMPHLRDAEAAGLPITPEVVARAAYMARQDMDTGVVRVLQGLSGEELVQTLGPRVLTELRRYDLKMAKERKGQGGQPPAPRASAPPAPERTRPLTEAEWREKRKQRGL